MSDWRFVELVMAGSLLASFVQDVIKYGVGALIEFLRAMWEKV